MFIQANSVLLHQPTKKFFCRCQQTVTGVRVLTIVHHMKNIMQYTYIVQSMTFQHTFFKQNGRKTAFFLQNIAL